MERWLTSLIKDTDQVSSWNDMGYMELSSCFSIEINIHIDVRLVSQGISVVS